ncbi:hypothetical protein ACSSV1_006096 [Labrenzia sp. MBR-25]
MLHTRRSILKAIGISALVTPMAGCMTQSGWFNPTTSVDAANLSPSAASIVAGDMVAKLSEHVGAGTGTIFLKADNSQFGLALESSLRGWGYAVAEADQQPSGDTIIPLAYTVGSDAGQIFVRLTTPTVELARTYQATATGASPTSPVSVLTRTA